MLTLLMVFVMMFITVVLGMLLMTIASFAPILLVIFCLPILDVLVIKILFGRKKEK